MSEELTKCREAFEAWVKTKNQAEIKWIGHSYANAYMAAQWEGWQVAWDAAQRRQAELVAALDMLLIETVDKDLKHGITLSEGEEQARDEAIIAIARALGQAEEAA